MRCRTTDPSVNSRRPTTGTGSVHSSGSHTPPSLSGGCTSAFSKLSTYLCVYLPEAVSSSGGIQSPASEGLPGVCRWGFVVPPDGSYPTSKSSSSNCVLTIVARKNHLSMITTTLRRTLLRSTASAPLARSRPCLSCAKRQFATSPPSAPHSATSPAASMLGALTGELDKLAPRFELHASQIRILQAPGEFYETLKVIG